VFQTIAGTGSLVKKTQKTKR